MSRSCSLRGKSAVRANKVSHSNIKTPRRQKPNLQLLTVGGKITKACSTCRRTITKKPVVRVPRKQGKPAPKRKAA